MSRSVLWVVLAMGGAVTAALSHPSIERAVAQERRGEGQAWGLSSPGEGWQEIELDLGENLQGRAFSDLAAGCHAAHFSVPASESAELSSLQSSFSQGLGTKGLSVQGVPTSSRMALEGEGVEGWAELWLEAERASILSCYWSEREPTYCSDQCAKVAGQRGGVAQ